MKAVSDVRSDIGLSRQHQEDSYLIDDKLGLYLVADGMGGAVAGDLASRTACEVIREHLQGVSSRLSEVDIGTVGDPAKVVFDLMSEAVSNANDRLRQMARDDERLSGMGTTVVMVLAVGEHLYLAHVGDSRAYLVRNGQMHQLTRDHSLVEELKMAGKVQSAEDVKARYRNTITRAVGAFEIVEPDTIDLIPLPGDRLLLCSDGVHGAVPAEEIARSLGFEQPGECADSLVRQANSRGGKDNITALVLDIHEVEPEKAQKTQDKLNVIKSVNVFKNLSFDELIRVVSLLEERRFEAGSSIIREGEAGDRMYILLDGEVWVMKNGVRVASLKRGDLFGEMALLDRSPRSADVLAFRSAVCLSLERNRFHSIIRECSPLSVKLLWGLARVFANRLRDTTRELGLAQGLYKSLEAQIEDSELYEDTFDNN